MCGRRCQCGVRRAWEGRATSGEGVGGASRRQPHREGAGYSVSSGERQNPLQRNQRAGAGFCLRSLLTWQLPAGLSQKTAPLSHMGALPRPFNFAGLLRNERSLQEKRLYHVGARVWSLPCPLQPDASHTRDPIREAAAMPAAPPHWRCWHSCRHAPPLHRQHSLHSAPALPCFTWLCCWHAGTIPTAPPLLLLWSVQATVGQPIQCKAAIAWEANKPLEARGTRLGSAREPC